MQRVDDTAEIVEQRLKVFLKICILVMYFVVIIQKNIFVVLYAGLQYPDCTVD